MPGARDEARKAGWDPLGETLNHGASHLHVAD